MNNPLVGQSAPDFSLEMTNGQRASMAQYRNGQPAIVFFWATWCPHCRRQLIELQHNYKSIEENGIKVILVDVGENLQTIQAYNRVNNITFDNFMDINAEVAGLYKIVGVPTFFFINREGIVLDVMNYLPDNYSDILLR